MDLLPRNLQKLEFFKRLDKLQQEDQLDRLTTGFNSPLESSSHLLKLSNTLATKEGLSSFEANETLKEINSYIAHMLYHIYDMKIFYNQIEQILASTEEKND